MGTIILKLLIMLAVLTPAIIFYIIFAIIIWVIETKRIKSKAFKIIIIAIILSGVFCAFIIWHNTEIDRPNDLYIKMNEISENETLIGLSEEEVIELLGEPKIKADERGVKSYTYSAGKTVRKTIFGREYHTRYYDLQMRFDENNKVKGTGIQQIP